MCIEAKTYSDVPISLRLHRKNTFMLIAHRNSINYRITWLQLVAASKIILIDQKTETRMLQWFFSSSETVSNSKDNISASKFDKITNSSFDINLPLRVPTSNTGVKTVVFRYFVYFLLGFNVMRSFSFNSPIGDWTTEWGWHPSRRKQWLKEQ